MKRLLIWGILLGCWVSVSSEAQAWGFWAHKRINRMAVFTLPPEMLGLYKKHIAYLTDKATAPDMRRYAVQGEAPRHYIDIDQWGTYPFDNLPRTWNGVQEQYWELWVVYNGDSLRLSGPGDVRSSEDSVWFKGPGVAQLLGRDSLYLDRKAYREFRFAEFPYGSLFEPQNLPVEKVRQLLGQPVEAAWVEDHFSEEGIIPYSLPQFLKRLTRAFEAQDLKQILRLSADIGHYVGDAHVPLHTTVNYNGQLTGQKGIHGFWESRLPELFAEDYDFLIGKAAPTGEPEWLIWQAVFESHRALDSVLMFEKELSESFPEDQKYGYESRNNVVRRVYSRDYSAAYHDRMAGMVERRMRMAISRLGTLWYTAWYRAGQPDLRPLYETEIEDAPDTYEKKLKIIDREAQGFGFQRVFEGTPLQDTRKAGLPQSKGWWVLMVVLVSVVGFRLKTDS